MKLVKLLFDVTDYRVYLRDYLESSGRRSGKKTELARAIRVPLSHISQVIGEKTHLTLEQADDLADFLDLLPDQKEYFLLLVQKGRAGTHKLHQYFERQIQSIQEKKSTVSGRYIPSTGIPQEVASEYYATWMPLAANLAYMIPSVNNPADLSRCLGISKENAQRVTQFLSDKGLIQFTQGQFTCADLRMFLDRKNPLLQQHHANWRIKSLAAVQNMQPENLHYSIAFSANDKTWQKIKSLLLESIDRNLDTIEIAPSENVYALTLDSYCLTQA